MISLCLCILWALLVTMLVQGKQPTGMILSGIGALLISIICIQLGIK
ncbi:hypothetical protein PHB09_127 [Pseudomonas phage PHB09]|uniref:Uncharacterized protein n=1 Tax=Pseudomonas phage PHB09 TaxID=2867265 RepID=A0AAE8XD80_9CAUD|nr:hypothetical protein QGX10_gp126 [Pseudomonas phage PHB09]UAV84622.1 hypothetical protein PHB09_127 [Pseudomonas phage PHB09]